MSHTGGLKPGKSGLEGCDRKKALKPAEKRDVVLFVHEEYGLSVSKTCTALRISPHTFFEKGVFMLKVAHTLDVRSFHAAELALPGVERGAADTVLTIYVLGSPVRFARLQD